MVKSTIELWQWIREYSMKTKNRYNPNAKLAEELEITPAHLSHVVHYTASPSLELALKIQQLSDGKVNAYELIEKTKKKTRKK
jgi:plasmid maintenance system antidote protein VapI